MKKITLLIAVSVIALASCTQQKSTDSAPAQKITKVKVEVAQKEMVAQVVEFTGNIEPFVKNNISSSSAQRIEKIYVEVGSRVSKGQLLVRMENPAYTQTKMQVENLKLDLGRTEALHKAGGVSLQQYNQMKTQYEVALDGLVNLDKNTKLLAPVGGIVTQRNFDNGDLTMGQPILTVMQLEPVKIMINISEEYYPQTKVGTPVDITLDIYPGKTFAGKVSLVYPTIDPTTRTFPVQVTISNASLKLRPGMFARASVNFGEKMRVVIPDKSVIKQSGTNDKYVYVLNGDAVSYTQVMLGRRLGDKYEVLKGVEEGQKVIVAGLSNLIDKAKVEVVTSGADLSL